MGNDKYCLQKLNLIVQVVKELPVGIFQASCDGAKPLKIDADKSRHLRKFPTKKKK